MLGADPPYARPSNAAFTVEVSDLELRLPTREGAAPAAVTGPGTQVTGPTAVGSQVATSSRAKSHKRHKKRKKKRKKRRRH